VDALVLRRTTTDDHVIAAFGREWQTFTHADTAGEGDLRRAFDAYFQIFPWTELPANAVAPMWLRHRTVGALRRAARWQALLRRAERCAGCRAPCAAGVGNCELIQARADAMPILDQSLDFAYCLGVLHHVSNTEASLAVIVRKLKPGAPLLLYSTSAGDPADVVRALWHMATYCGAVSRLPFSIRLTVAT